MDAEPATISPPQQGQLAGDDVFISPMVQIARKEQGLTLQTTGREVKFV
jgi:hypothetical protein